MNRIILAALVIANVITIVGVARAEGNGTVLVCDGSMTHCTTHTVTATPVHAPKGTVR